MSWGVRNRVQNSMEGLVAMARRRYLIAGLAAVAVFGSVAASAATLGGVTAGGLGADTTLVASCDTDGVSLSYGTAFAVGGYQVTSVTVKGINGACDTQNLQVTLTGSAGAALSAGSTTLSITGTSTTNSATVTLSTPVSANAVTGAAVVIGS
jgi:hypothetical protein